MKITLKNTPEQVELVKAMASKNRAVAYEAQTALAEFIGPVLAQVINNAPALSNMFTDLPFMADDNPSLPLELYYDVADEDYVKVYSQARLGGLVTSEVLPTSSELKIATYNLDSAVSVDRRYAAKSRMDVIAKTMTRVAQEILQKQNKISANVIFNALANATTGGLDHVIDANTADRFTLADMNAILTRSKRITTSWIGGTPDNRGSRGVTDLVMSPEMVEELRAIAYNPINTKSAPGGVAHSSASPVQTADVIAERAFNAAGAPEFYGLNVIELIEFGTSQSFNTVYANYAASGSTTAQGFAGTATEEIILGVDRTRESLIRPYAVDSENGGSFSLVADDQFNIRQGKIGWFGGLEEGRVVVDDRALVGIQV
jgi:hypothetical protein